MAMDSIITPNWVINYIKLKNMQSEVCKMLLH